MATEKKSYDFTQRIREFKSAVNSYRKLGMAISMAALEHFIAEGDSRPVRQFEDALPDGAKAGYRLWVMKFCPMLVWTIKHGWRQRVLKEGETPASYPHDLEGASKIAFCDYKVPGADKIVETLSNPEEVEKAIVRTIRKFHNENKFRLEGAALSRLREIETALRNIKIAVPSKAAPAPVNVNTPEVAEADFSEERLSA